MNNSLVRICRIELKGFKNIEFGSVEMPLFAEKDFFSRRADILGIYGQNGSGKTAIIESMTIIQALLTGQNLPKKAENYISKENKACSISVKFIIESKITAFADYFVELKYLNEGKIEISREFLSFSPWNGEKFEGKKILIDYHLHSQSILFTPKYRYEDIIHANEENKVNLMVAKKLAQINNCSFIFGSEGKKTFTSQPNKIFSDYDFVISALHKYACIDLFIIPNANAGAISMSLLLPLSFRFDQEEEITKGDFAINLNQPTLIAKEQYDIVKKILGEINIVLTTIIPELSIEIYDLGEQLLADGTLGNKIELFSKRGNTKIPLAYESEGILKIISILNVLLCIYNSPSICLIIDELDSGIYEYLLGELLSVLERGAKGQLIFTSHNLRALEMLNKKSIVFSTTNPKNRYIHLQNIKSNNNLRDMYLRSITLGGQKEEIYAQTDSTEIGRAFRRAGRVAADEK
ncbi:MAG: AAA family ATPase [Oscillospiraceae bacterium]